ncbi:nuclear transport factor 2 family protein [Xanthomonas sp. PPL139]|uniref:nuclear transport factor 2 family protein n=1 Tax=unclassified Xanthomonas TaxID=2643310 RepID=UPI00339FB501
MQTLPLPEPIAAYFAAEHSPDALTHCFTAHAVFNDNGHTYTGIDAIKTFMAEASAKFSATSQPFAIEQENDIQCVRANVAGNFPGSPVVLAYRFRLEGGLIAALEVTA